jgi:hypothetical protein
LVLIKERLYNVVSRIRNVSLSLSLGSIQNIDVMRPTVITAHTVSAVAFSAHNALWAVDGYNTPTQPLFAVVVIV